MVQILIENINLNSVYSFDLEGYNENETDNYETVDFNKQENKQENKKENKQEGNINIEYESQKDKINDKLISYLIDNIKLYNINDTKNKVEHLLNICNYLFIDLNYETSIVNYKDIENLNIILKDDKIRSYLNIESINYKKIYDEYICIVKKLIDEIMIKNQSSNNDLWKINENENNKYFVVNKILLKILDEFLNIEGQNNLTKLSGNNDLENERLKQIIFFIQLYKDNNINNYFISNNIRHNMIYIEILDILKNIVENLN